MRLRRLPAAIADVDALWLYIAQNDPAAADKLVNAIDATSRRLLDFPHLGRARPELQGDLRSLVVKPYVVFYRVVADEVLVVRVLHSARDIEPMDFAPRD